MISRVFRSRWFACLMHLLLPGLGHVLYHEFLFGLFVFLVMQLAAVLLVVSFLVNIPVVARWVLLGLPVLFYGFSFFDLARTTSQKRERFVRSSALLTGAILLGLAYQLFAPTSPGNFFFRNRPDVFRGESNDYAPMVTRDRLATANRMAYSVEIPVMNRAILHALPERFDVIRYLDEKGAGAIGLVVGLPSEEIECHDGLISAQGDIEPLPRLGKTALGGSWPLTAVDSYSILVADVRLGVVTRVFQVSLVDVIGRVGHATE